MEFVDYNAMILSRFAQQKVHQYRNNVTQKPETRAGTLFFKSNSDSSYIHLDPLPKDELIHLNYIPNFNLSKIREELAQCVKTCPTHLSFRQWMIEKNPQSLKEADDEIKSLSIASYVLISIGNSLSHKGSTPGEQLYNHVYFEQEELFGYQPWHRITDQKFEGFRKVLLSDLLFSEPNSIKFIQSYLFKYQETDFRNQRSQELFQFFKNGIENLIQEHSPHLQSKIETLLGHFESSFQDNLSQLGLLYAQTMVTPNQKPLFQSILKKRLSNILPLLGNEEQIQIKKLLVQSNSSQPEPPPNLTPLEKLRFHFQKNPSLKEDSQANALLQSISSARDFQLALMDCHQETIENAEKLAKDYATCFQTNFETWKPSALEKKDLIQSFMSFIVKPREKPTTFLIELPESHPELDILLGRLSLLCDVGKISHEDQLFDAQKHNLLFVIQGSLKNVENQLLETDQVEGFYSFLSRVNYQG
ncbi:MAG: hypothetical protein K2X66_16270 [Cyanobacteria bacterium]|nr:hypothetical protein [Cyanobacteriota bacterium]